jgi:hypothetical protein
MSSYKPVLTVVALLTLLAVAAPGVETAADLTALPQVQSQSHHVELVTASRQTVHTTLDAAVAVVHTACTEAASLLSSWPTMLVKAIALFDAWMTSFGLPDLT